MQFIVGGYYLVRGAERRTGLTSKLIPFPFWSVSRCICEILPDSWVFTWTTDNLSSKQREHYQEVLALDKTRFLQMQKQFDSFLEDDLYGFPNVFFSLELARDYGREYLGHLPDIKLLSIALPENQVAPFIEASTPTSSVAENGVRKKLRAHCPLDSAVSFRGFEILGYDGASFCSFVCNSLERDYHEKLRIAFNSNGLIDNYEDAVKATDFTMSGEVGAEPYSWRPWLVSEYPIEG